MLGRYLKYFCRNSVGKRKFQIVSITYVLLLPLHFSPRYFYVQSICTQLSKKVSSILVVKLLEKSNLKMWCDRQHDSFTHIYKRSLCTSSNLNHSDFTSKKWLWKDMSEYYTHNLLSGIQTYIESWRNLHIEYPHSPCFMYQIIVHNAYVIDILF